MGPTRSKLRFDYRNQTTSLKSLGQSSPGPLISRCQTNPEVNARPHATPQRCYTIIVAQHKMEVPVTLKNPDMLPQFQ
ncbi:hypothetical protein BX616_003948 [Lobosporangium transversale]|nr:hypothetical protein BX616_003948 [Lobosporangium transversale]